MKRFFRSLFLKMLAFVTVCILTPILALCIIGVSENVDDGMYYESEPGYENTDAALNFVWENLAQVREYIYWHDVSGLVEDKVLLDHKNFFYTVYDGNGKEVFSSLPKNAVIHEKEEEGSEGIIRIYDGYPAEEVTENGDHVADCSLSGFIRMPLDPNESGYKEYMAYKFRWDYRNEFINYGIACFVICALLTLYLIAGAGRNSEGELALRGLNAVGYDLMIGLYSCGVMTLIAAAASTGYFQSEIKKYVSLAVIFAVSAAITLIFLMNISAHLKMPYWWRHCVIYWGLELIVKAFLWITENIGITWQLVLIVGAFGAGLYLMGLFTYLSPLGLFLGLLFGLAGLAAAIWVGIQLNSLKKGGEAIAQGNFDYRVNAKELWPVFRRHAFNLNSAALGMSKEVDNRMKSEHFKTELITNVSHDLKTPLTSIVSYIDLLKAEQIENENAKEYIEVIDRQAAKLKKLTEDLVEASKATSGAIAVNKEQLNIGELMNQSVGEFTEKLEQANIIPVVNIPEEEVKVFADGRLLWRVFDNLIQNIIKYAQPGTRAYFDLETANKNAVLTVKNISKEPLNMTAEALMERFVRGDVSRGESEGNGLGLSIAKSFTELCGGTFELFLDGDLYKVVITMPVV